MRNFINIRELAGRTKIGVRRLRYIFDNKILPDEAWEIFSDEPGTPRSFDEQTGISIAAAAYLLEAGLPRELVRKLMYAAWESFYSYDNKFSLSFLMQDALEKSKKSILEFGDASHIRLISSRKTSDWYWFEGKFRIDENYAPKVVIQVHIDKIRKSVCPEQ